MLESPEANAQQFETRGVDYVYLSSYERSNFAVDEEWFSANGSLVFEEGSVRIYALSQRAIIAAKEGP